MCGGLGESVGDKKPAVRRVFYSLKASFLL